MSKRAWRRSQGGTRPATVSTEPQGTGPAAVAFRWLMPAGVGREAAPLLVGRGLRALADGYAAVLMAATGLGFTGLTSFWPVLVVAFVGTLNPSSGDVSVFLPLDHARLASAAAGPARTALFARYSVVGAVCAAVGALGAAVPDLVASLDLAPRVAAMRGMFALYGVVGLLVWRLYRLLPSTDAATTAARSAPLGPSRRVVVRLAALFSVDAFAGGLVVNALLSLLLLQRFELSIAQAGAFFFWAGMLSAASQLAAPAVASRIGQIGR